MLSYRQNTLSTLVALAALCLTACGSDKSVHSPPLLEADRAVVWFDTVDGVPKSDARITIANVGGSVTPTMTTEVHGDVGQIRITNDECGQHAIGPGGRCTVTVTLQGELPGDYGGQLVVALPESNPVEVELHGKVTPAALQLTATSADADVATDAGGRIDVTLKNAGGATSGPVALTVDGGAHLGPWCMGKRLAGGEECFVAILYSAPPNAPATALVNITASADPGGTDGLPLAFHNLPLEVSGYYEIMLTGAKADGTMYVSHHAPQPITWTKAEIVMDGLGNACHITRDWCTGTTRPPGSSCPIEVQCSAGTPGFNPGSLLLSDDHGTIGKGQITVFGAAAVVRVDYTGSGQGEVKGGSEVSVGGSKSASFGISGAGSFQMTATAKPGSVFAGWTGACAGTSPTCTLSLHSGDVDAAEARFEPAQ
jgi:Divergent InlB B-repeat domain